MINIKKLLEELNSMYTTKTITVTINNKVLNKEEAEKYEGKFDKVFENLDKSFEELAKAFKDIEDETK